MAEPESEKSSSPPRPSVCSWSEIWNEVEDFNGWVSTFGEAQEVQKRFETDSSLRYVGYKKTTNFGCNSSLQVQDAAGGRSS